MMTTMPMIATAITNKEIMDLCIYIITLAAPFACLAIIAIAIFFLREYSNIPFFAKKKAMMEMESDLS